MEGRQDSQLRIDCSADVVGVPHEITHIEKVLISRTVIGGNGLEMIRMKESIRPVSAFFYNGMVFFFNSHRLLIFVFLCDNVCVCVGFCLLLLFFVVVFFPFSWGFRGGGGRL